MKITRRQLRRMINESLGILNEGIKIPVKKEYNYKNPHFVLEQIARFSKSIEITLNAKDHTETPHSEKAVGSKDDPLRVDRGLQKDLATLKRLVNQLEKALKLLGLDDSASSSKDGG